MNNIFGSGGFFAAAVTLVLVGCDVSEPARKQVDQPVVQEINHPVFYFLK